MSELYDHVELVLLYIVEIFTDSIASAMHKKCYTLLPVIREKNRTVADG